MQASSEASLKVGLDVLDSLESQFRDNASDIARQFFLVSDLLDNSPQLLTGLSNPACSNDAKVKLVRDVLTDEVSPVVVNTMESFVAQRWSKSDDLRHATVRAGLQAMLTDARQKGLAERLRNELFALREFLTQNRDVRMAIDESVVIPVKNRLSVLDTLFGGKILPHTMQMLRRILVSRHRESITAELRKLAHIVALRAQNALWAVVSCATEPTPEQLERLRALLEKKYGQKVVVNVAVDPNLVGGMRVAIESDIFDGSVATALNEARVKIAGQSKRALEEKKEK